MLLGNTRKEPFTESGTFATDLDGWTQTSGSASWSSTNFRTSTGAVSLSASSAMEITIDNAVCGGLTITASIWHKTAAGTNQPRTLSYKIGSGSFVTLATVTDTSMTYAQLSGSFENPGDDDVTIKFSVGGGSIIYADDWSISGV